MSEHQRQAWLDGMEKYRADFERWKAEVDARKPMYDAVIRYGELAIRSLLLVAGGAAVALAGFAGSSIGSSSAAVRQALASSILWLGLAAAGAVATAGLAYVAQVFFAEAPQPRNEHLGAGVRLVAVLFFIGSLVCFVWGAYLASLAVAA
jgi:hypothetical protein